MVHVKQDDLRFSNLPEESALGQLKRPGSKTTESFLEQRGARL